MIIANITEHGFEVSGHADYAEKGKDIVCAAVSALVMNTIISIGELTDARTAK